MDMDEKPSAWVSAVLRTQVPSWDLKDRRTISEFENWEGKERQGDRSLVLN